MITPARRDLLNTELECLEALRQLVDQLFLAPARNLFHGHDYNSELLKPGRV